MLLNPFDDRGSDIRAKTVAIYAILITANIVAWIWAWTAFADRPVLLGTALLAYAFGLRHAFDADHIAAIDNVVRKLMQEDKAPYSVGLLLFARPFHHRRPGVASSLPRRRRPCRTGSTHSMASAA